MRTSRWDVGLLVLAVLTALAGCSPPSAGDPPSKPGPSLAAGLAATTVSSTAPAPDTSKMLIDLRKPSAVEGWQVADDRVIGGLSQGAMKTKAPASAVFEGNISQHSGGFVTVRCPNGAFDLSGFAGLEIRVRGDGRAYQAMVKTEAVETGFAYYYWFETREGAWQTVRLSFVDFKANFRGIGMAWSHLDPAKVVSLGFLIANWQEGPFRLEVEWIKAYK